MADGLIGSWQSTSYENIEAFMEAMGVPDSLRQQAQDRKTELTIDRKGECWKLVTKAGEKSREVVFPLGQEVDTITLMGQQVKAKLVEQDGQLLETQSGPGGDITIKRSLVDGKLRTDMTIKGVTAGINFTKV